MSELHELLDLGDDTSKDEQIMLLELAAVAFVERQTGRFFGPEGSWTMYVAGDGTPTLWLPEPISSGTPTVTQRIYAGEIATTPITDFVIRNGHLLRTGSGYWNQYYEYAVTGNRGYTAGNEPEDIKQLVRDLVKLGFTTDGGAMKSEAFAGYSYTRAELNDMPMLGRTLNAWRRIRV